MRSFLAYVGSGHLFPRATRGTYAVLLRRGIAVLVMWEVLGALLVFPFDGPDSSNFVFLIIGLVLAIALLLGAFLPVTIVGLLLYLLPKIAPTGGFWSLGTETAVWGLVAMCLFPGVSKRDIDQALIRLKIKALSPLLARTYANWLFFPQLQITAARWISLLFFGLTAAFSVAMHAQDQYWKTGLVGPYLLTSTYMSRFHDSWMQVFSESAFSLSVLSLASGLFIPVFGLIPILLLFRGHLASFILKGATLSFFIFSLLFLQLGILPFVEILLWAFWFLPKRRQSKSGHDDCTRFVVFYDDMCGLCQGTRRLFGFLDTTAAFRWAPISNSENLLKEIGIGRLEATQDITALDSSGTIVQGFHFYRRAVVWIPTLTLLAPLVYLGQLTTIGPRLYSFVRDRRVRKSEYCSLSPAPDLDESTKTVKVARSFAKESNARKRENVSRNRPWFTVLLIFLSITAGDYLLSNPVIVRGVDVANFRPAALGESTRMLGLAPIDVFNGQDLLMSEHWIVVSNNYHSSRSVVPLTWPDGSRGPLQLIGSLYFGVTVAARRAMIPMSDEERCNYLTVYAEQPRLRTALNRLLRGNGSSYTLTLMYKPLPEITDYETLDPGSKDPIEVCALEFSTVS